MNKEINYEKFMKDLMAKLKGMMGKECSLFMDDIPIINGNVKHSLTIRCKDKEIAPCICMDGFYHDYVNGYLEMAEIAEMTASIYKRETEHDDLDTDFIKDWESAKKRYGSAWSIRRGIPECSKGCHTGNFLTYRWCMMFRFPYRIT